MSAPARPQDLTGTVVRGVGFASSDLILTRALILAAYIVLARLITPQELGHFAAGSIVVGIGVMLAGSGMAAAVIHRRDRLEEALATAVIATVLAGALLGLLAVAISPLLGAFFDSATVAAVAAALAGVLFLNSARVVPGALLQRRFLLLRRAVIEPAAATAFGVGAIITSSHGLGVWGLVIGEYASAVTRLVLTWALARWRPSLRLASLATWRELIAYGRHVLAGSAVRMLGEQVPTLAAGGFVSAAALGQFRYAHRIAATALAALVSGASYVVFPAFARISNDARRFEAAFIRSLRWMTLLAVPMGALLLALGEPLAVLVLGEPWTEAGEAARALALFVPAQTIADVIGEAFKGTGRPAERTRVNVAGLAAMIIAMAALIPPFGLIGVAAGASVGSLAGAGYSIWRAWRVIPIPLRPMLDAVAAPLAAALPVVAALLPLEALVLDAASHGTSLGLGILAIEGLVGLAIYAAGLRVVTPGVGGELAGLLRAGRKADRRELVEPRLTEEPELSDA